METIFNITDIQEALLHRYPFLLIDKVVNFVDNESLIAIKNVTINEEFFNGHFPGRPVMPGVLILEAMAQSAAFCAVKSSKGIAKGKAVLLAGADNVKWKRMVLPGDQLEIRVKFCKARKPFWYFDGEAYVDGKLVAKASLLAAETD